MGVTSRGWYQDPDDPELARWHDGHEMTEHTLVIADQPQGRTPAPPDDQPAWLDDEEISWSPDALPDPEESLYTPRHRARTPDAEQFWNEGVSRAVPEVRWSKLAMPLGIVALVVAAAVGFQLRDDGGDRGGLTSVDAVSPADGLTPDDAAIGAMDARRPAVSVPTSAVTAPSTTTTALSTTTTTTKKAAGKMTAKPPAPTTTTTTTVAPPTSAPSTTTTAAVVVTAGESCAPEGATAHTSSGDPVSCAPACGGASTDLVWRAPDC
jgi:hypothetical protein